MKDYRSTLNTVGWILAAFSTIFVATRIYTRLRITTARFGWDDWCMLIAWVLAIICTSLVTVGTRYGFGQHMVDIKDPEDRAKATMYVLFAPLFSIASAFFTKTSIVISLLRIVGRTGTWVHKLLAWISLLILFITGSLSCGIIIFFCQPVQKSWRPNLEGSCLNPQLLDLVGRGTSVYNALMDVFCAIVPYYLIRRLTIPCKEKRNLFILMGACLFGTIATIMKVISMSTISNVADITHSWSEITIWYLCENHILIIAGSFPALRPFWRTMRGKYGSYKSSGRSDSSANTPKRTTEGDFHVHTVGSAPRERKIPGLYSIAARNESEETLGGGENREADTESIEAILSHHGDHQTHITRGSSTELHVFGDTNIKVTRVVDIR